MDFKEMAKLFYYYANTVSCSLDLDTDILNLFEVYSEINGSNENLLTFDEWLKDNELVEHYSSFIDRLGL